MNINGTSGNDNLVGSASDDVLWGGSGNDSLDGAAGNDELYGDAGNDSYIIRDRWDQVHDIAGIDSALVYINFYKTDPAIESWNWAAGVEKLPYWIDALLPSVATGFVPMLGSSKTYYYSFPASAPSYYSSTDASGFKAFTAEQQAFARQAFAYISSIVDLRFVETLDVAAVSTIALANNIQSSSSGYAYFPHDSFRGSDVLLNYSGSSSQNLSPSEGTFSAITLIHELGHAIGLKHPFSHSASGIGTEDGPYLPTAENSSLWTVMSYNNSAAEYHLRFSPLDIAALQYLYGPSTAITDNNTYTLTSSGPNFIWDGGGTDTIDGSALTQALTLYLEPGFWGFIGTKSLLITDAAQVTVNFGTLIENAKGGSASDAISGNAAANRIYGFAGNDVIMGGAGNDMLDGGEGDDTFLGMSGWDAIYGGNGTDKLSLAQTSTSMHVTKLRGEVFIVNDASGTNLTVCRNVEQIQFSDVAVSLSDSMAFVSPDTTLSQIYVAAFRRAPESEGINYWTQEVATRGIDEVAEIIFSLDIVKAIYPASMSASQFVTAIYTNVFDRSPDPEGLNYWTQQLMQRSRGQLVIDMTNAALGVPDGTSGKDYFQNRLDWSLYAVGYQHEQGREMTPMHLTELTNGIGAETSALVTLIGQAESGIVI